MRSDLVFGALSHVSNRYQLCQLASKATRKLHKPNTRLQDTTNEVLDRFHFTNPGSAAPVRGAAASRPVETAARRLTRVSQTVIVDSGIGFKAASRLDQPPSPAFRLLS